MWQDLNLNPAFYFRCLWIFWFLMAFLSVYSKCPAHCFAMDLGRTTIWYGDQWLFWFRCFFNVQMSSGSRFQSSFLSQTWFIITYGFCCRLANFNIGHVRQNGFIHWLSRLANIIMSLPLVLDHTGSEFVLDSLTNPCFIDNYTS
jgi:hypothetical protein